MELLHQPQEAQRVDRRRGVSAEEKTMTVQTLRELREQTGKSVEAVAGYLAVSTEYVEDFENGGLLDIVTAVMLAKFYCTSLEEIADCAAATTVEVMREYARDVTRP